MSPKISPRLAPRFHHCRRLFFILFFIRGDNVKQRERVPLGALFIYGFWFPVMRSCTENDRASVRSLRLRVYADLLFTRSGASARRRSVPVAVIPASVPQKGILNKNPASKLCRIPNDVCLLICAKNRPFAVFRRVCNVCHPSVFFPCFSARFARKNTLLKPFFSPPF